MKKGLLICLLVSFVGCKALGPAVSVVASGINQYMATKRTDEVNSKLDALLIERGIDTAAIAEVRKNGGSLDAVVNGIGWIAQVTGLVDENKTTAGVTGGVAGSGVLYALWAMFKKYRSNNA